MRKRNNDLLETNFDLGQPVSRPVWLMI